MQQLLNQLNSRDPAIRDAALRAARALPPDQLLQLVLLESRNRRMRFRRGWAVYVAVYTLIFILGHNLHFPTQGTWSYLHIILTVLAASMVQGVYTNKYNSARRRISELLSEVEDTRFIAAMLRMEFREGQVGVKELHATVKRLLPQIRADHAPHWSKEDKAALLLPLKRPKYDRELALGCLKALEQVGDASAIPAVKKLLPKMYPAQWKEGIALAAQECLFYLESNTGRFQQAETLLRASETATRPDILLRPAQSAPDTTPAEQLLRPGE